MTTNTYDGARRVQVVDVTEPYVAGGGSYVTVPVEVTVAGEATTVTVAGDPKPSPSFTLGEWSANDTTYSAAITYTGDGVLSANVGAINNGSLTVGDADGNFSGFVSAAEGNVYAPGLLSFSYKTNTVEGTPVTVTVEAEPVTVTVSGGGSSPAVEEGLLDPNLRIEEIAQDHAPGTTADVIAFVTWDGDGVCYAIETIEEFDDSLKMIEKGTEVSDLQGQLFLLDSDGLYAKDWRYIPFE